MNTSTLRSITAVVTALLIGVTSLATADVCNVPDVGGTAILPPIGCEYVAAPGHLLQILPPALQPAGNTIDIDPIIKDFNPSVNQVFSVPLPPGQTEGPGGALGGNVQGYLANFEMTISGTGPDFGTYNRLITIFSVVIETHSGPRTPGDPVQAFSTDMYNLSGSVFGDPDFSTLSILGGSVNGLPSHGYTTLTDIGGGVFEVDSFFDIEYEIDFVGAPGSVLEGMSGVAEGTVRVQMGSPTQPGDFNGDLIVDGADFLKWQREDGTPASLLEWETFYGDGALSAATASVPEPSGLALFAAGLLGMGYRRQKQA
jgi:hypothetical protein